MKKANDYPFLNNIYRGDMTMFLIRTNNRDKEYTKGFSLIELIVVISIMAIISSIAVPAYAGYRKKAEENVCKANSLQLERLYEVYLISENLTHTESAFSQYLHEYDKDICPNHGEISYVDEKIECSVHPREDDSNSDEDEGEVPYL
jgi:prepilin-type N-terminal cleavage/methylation domain-containing protein